jgi:hypothetical protein
MNFKLNFYITGESELSKVEIFDRINTVLAYKKYRVLAITYNRVTFDCNPWRLKWNFEPIQVNRGMFEVHPSNDRQSVSLKYDFNFLHPIIFIIIFFSILISDKQYDGLWFFGIFYTIAMTIQIIRVRGKGRALLRDILVKKVQ